MTKLSAGAKASRGYWFNAKTWTLHPVSTDGETLPGAAGEKYLRIPLLLAFVVAPLMGAAFLMFLPFIGFYLAFQAALRPVAKLFRHTATEMAATMSPGWAPGEAHLTGKRAEGEGVEEKGPTAAATDELAKVEREIAARRGEQK
ncbi:MAG: hypothetical protein ACJ79E_05235 [Anaeromyxobacteraceae bacterium]